MQLKEYFQKPIDRTIETVIKADDREHIFTEVDEYIVTDEIAKKIAHFFTLYNEYSMVNGAWISGFFGSGKSHLLKILSYVLENRDYEGSSLGTLFAEKIVDDQMLKADVERAIKIPSHSILFNIDQQAQITSKKEDDAVLHVFYKVFYDYLGFFGSQRHVAEFELWLTGEGKYREFKEAYEREAGEPWYEGRRKYFAPNTKRATANVLAQLMGGNASEYVNIMDDLQKNHTISPDDFGQKVANHIKEKGGDFRLNFFVDEVGQFIADNSKLMLSLQTIAETLAIKCKGRSWLFVTSQEDLGSVIGDDSKSQSDDFSKIQGRFKVRIPLTSANVDEVIEKRLLAKTTLAQTDLKHFYRTEQANLETLISFSENGIQFRRFRDEADFVSKYPFLPYQFDLFQQCIKELSKHNIFQGKHHSVGERSMLGVFQEVLKTQANNEGKILISFDKMFEGLRSVIKGEAINSITFADKNLFNELSKKVLKALFMVKYYTNFKATAQNIAVLMLNSVNINFKEHSQNIQKALDQLENETYIRRSGELYEFLTDDEKDIEEEIKHVAIDQSDIIQLYNDQIYGNILSGLSKIRYHENRQEYEFTHKINGTLLGIERELTIDIITPDYERYNQLQHLKAQTMGVQTLMIMVLPDDKRLLQEVRIYKKTEKYLRQQQSSSNSDAVSRILTQKGEENNHRKRDLSLLLSKMLGEATVYLNGVVQIISNSSDGKTKVINAFQELVKLAFPRLNLIGNSLYSEESIKNTIRDRGEKIFGANKNDIGSAEQEVLNFIVRRKNQADRTSLNEIKDHFAKQPYGWCQNATFTLVAKLYRGGKIEARQDANILTDEDLLSNLTNNRTFANTLLEPQIDFNPADIVRLKNIYLELYDEPCPANEGREVAIKFKERSERELNELNQLIGAKGNYPFLTNLEPFINLLERVTLMGYRDLIDKIDHYQEELLVGKERLLDPIRRFWNGEQKHIYDTIIDTLKRDESNIEYLNLQDLELLKGLPTHTKPYEGSVIKEAKEALESLNQLLESTIAKEREESINHIKREIIKLESHTDFNRLSPREKKEVLTPINRLIEQCYSQRNIANLKQYKRDAENHFTSALNKVQQLLSAQGGVEDPPVEYIRRGSISVRYNKSELATIDDVESYIKALKEALIEQIKENRRISL
ncbi:MAG: BREX system P-loop protein BrxC [Bacteroidales bacterium]